MIFNNGRNIDIEPFLLDPQGVAIEYIQKTKLLGFILTEDLRTEENTKYIEKSIYENLVYKKITTVWSPG